MTTMRLATGIAAVIAALAAPFATAWGYPEFQREIVATSGRPVNCALCHTSADGPEGTAPGQIGRLSTTQLDELGRARAALEPNNAARNPILNPFGNQLLNQLGRKQLLELRLAPAGLADAIPAGSDLDADGISDADEVREGTHPLIASDGNPGRLFRHNVLANRTPLLLTLAATVLGLVGLKHLLNGFTIGDGTDADEREET